MAARILKRFTSSVSSKSRFHQPISDDLFPNGYLVTGLHSGIKKTGALDVAIALSTSTQTSAAASFTKNVFKAAPVLISQEVLQNNNGRVQAIVANSGCANAVTGKQGTEDARAMSEAAATVLSQVTPASPNPGSLVLSTGVIGQKLPIEKVLAGINKTKETLGSDMEAWERAARAFMTTDTFPKLRARSFALNGKTVRIAGIDKGAGMIHPNMGPPHATLLAMILTDASVEPRTLQTILNHAVERSFNAISVDGDMSTNDTVLLLANGASGMEQELDESRETDWRQIDKLRDEITRFATELAQLVVRDGEGATKFVTVDVRNAHTYEDAHSVASRISTSALVKTALFGEDANWGRILAATGAVGLSSGKNLDPTRVSVSFVPTDGSPLLELLIGGEPVAVDEDRAKKVLELEDIEVRVDLGVGQESAQYWTCDFSYDYVKINGDYRS